MEPMSKYALSLNVFDFHKYYKISLITSSYRICSGKLLILMICDNRYIRYFLDTCHMSIEMLLKFVRDVRNEVLICRKLFETDTYFTSNPILRNRETLYCEKYICHIYVYKNIFQKKVVDVVQLPL